MRWTRSLNFAAGPYRFYARSDDGVRVWLNGELIIDQWHEATNSTYSVDRTLSGGTHTLRVEYYENTGAAHAQVWWERAGSFPQWRGDYFSNATLSGAAAVVRNDRHFGESYDVRIVGELGFRRPWPPRRVPRQPSLREPTVPRRP